MEDIKKKVYRIIADQFSVSIDEINDDVGPGDYARWDSIGQLRLNLEIEKQFNIQLSVEDVILVNNVKDIIGVIQKIKKGNANQIESSQNKSTTNMSFYPIRFPSITYFGKNSISALNDLEFDRIAIITGSSQYADQIVNQLTGDIFKEKSIEIFQKPKGEPIETHILELSNRLNQYSPTHIIAAGGGSTIDTAKLSWLLYEKEDFTLTDINGIINDLNLRGKASFIAIPTTFGSGSEVSSAAAFTKDNSYSKSIIVSHDFIPDIVILDPTLGKSANLKTIYSCAFDALTHAVEGFVSIVDHPMLDSLAIRSAREIIEALKSIKSNEVNDSVMEKLCYSAYYAGVVQNHCSVGLTHSFAHQLSPYGISHGTANAMFLLPVIERNSIESDKYKILAKETGFNNIKNFMNEINMLLKRSFVIPDKEIIEKIINDKKIITEGAINDITFKTNPIVLSKQEVETVFENAIEYIKNV